MMDFQSKVEEYNRVFKNYINYYNSTNRDGFTLNNLERIRDTAFRNMNDARDKLKSISIKRGFNVSYPIIQGDNTTGKSNISQIYIDPDASNFAGFIRNTFKFPLENDPQKQYILSPIEIDWIVKQSSVAAPNTVGKHPNVLRMILQNYTNIIANDWFFGFILYYYNDIVNDPEILDGEIQKYNNLVASGYQMKSRYCPTVTCPPPQPCPVTTCPPAPPRVSSTSTCNLSIRS